MLYSIDAIDYPITNIPHDSEYQLWRARLSSIQIEAIKAAIDQLFDNQDVRTAGWLPGTDWTRTVFEPIYEVACERSFGAAACCYGLLVWESDRARGRLVVSPSREQ